MRRTKAWLAVVVVLSVGAAGVAAQTAPTRAGVIVFSRADSGGRYSLWTVAPDTRRLRRVTRGCGWDWYPAWSPDGRRIAFARACGNFQPPKFNLDLYVVAANGKGPRRLVHTSTNEEWPTWSPDGSKIAFVSGEPQWIKAGQAGGKAAELWVVGANGHGLKRLTRNTVRDATPAWSPDGKWIAFSSSRPGHKGIWIISADGRHPHPLGIDGGEPAWSPDGTQLAFAHGRARVARETVDLYIANADGSGLRRLTHEAVGVVSHHPSWSPDGHSIIYMSSRGSDKNNLWIISATGHGARQLTRSPREDADPEWWKAAETSPTG